MLPIFYKGNLKYVDDKLEEIKVNYPIYTNYIENYFIKFKYKYFVNVNLNYDLIPKDIRSNSFLENYNRYIKKMLGDTNECQWINFIHFIKSASE